MSRIKLLLDVVEDMQSLSESLRVLAEAMQDAEPYRGSDEVLDKEDTAPSAPPTPTLEQVRAALTEKSRAGHSAEVRDLLRRYGASKLSMISPEMYEALLREAEVIGNAP